MSRTHVWSQMPRRNWQTHSLPAYAWAGVIRDSLEAARGRAPSPQLPRPQPGWHNVAPVRRLSTSLAAAALACALAAPAASAGQIVWVKASAKGGSAIWAANDDGTYPHQLDRGQPRPALAQTLPGGVLGEPDVFQGAGSTVAFTDTVATPAPPALCAPRARACSRCAAGVLAAQSPAAVPGRGELRDPAAADRLRRARRAVHRLPGAAADAPLRAGPLPSRARRDRRDRRGLGRHRDRVAAGARRPGPRPGGRVAARLGRSSRIPRARGYAGRRRAGVPVRDPRRGRLRRRPRRRSRSSTTSARRHRAVVARVVERRAQAADRRRPAARTTASTRSRASTSVAPAAKTVTELIAEPPGWTFGQARFAGSKIVFDARGAGPLGGRAPPTSTRSPRAATRARAASRPARPT